MWVVICGRKCASIVILASCDELKDSSQADLPKRLALLGTSESILWTGKNSNGKVVASAPVAPPSQAFLTLPTDALLSAIPILLLYRSRSLKALFSFPAFSFSRGEVCCFGRETGFSGHGFWGSQTGSKKEEAREN